ncbi:hypothetical protein DFH07DRAFT_772381 [Mycena maculata]|uniref:Uncharacterized protein n=1 Tax=Mycena maculata TaxID=230809 RepID=A0AAD7NEK9_9AGAR|nr:hypothetical protein DFH07DRAFT_772381 [Mycena maculata]
MSRARNLPLSISLPAFIPRAARDVVKRHAGQVKNVELHIEDDEELHQMVAPFGRLSVSIPPQMRTTSVSKASRLAENDLLNMPFTAGRSSAMAPLTHSRLQRLRLAMDLEFDDFDITPGILTFSHSSPDLLHLWITQGNLSDGLTCSESYLPILRNLTIRRDRALSGSSQFEDLVTMLTARRASRHTIQEFRLILPRTWPVHNLTTRLSLHCAGWSKTECIFTSGTGNITIYKIPTFLRPALSMYPCSGSHTECQAFGPPNPSHTPEPPRVGDSAGFIRVLVASRHPLLLLDRLDEPPPRVGARVGDSAGFIRFLVASRHPLPLLDRLRKTKIMSPSRGFNFVSICTTQIYRPTYLAMVAPLGAEDELRLLEAVLYNMPDPRRLARGSQNNCFHAARVDLCKKLPSEILAEIFLLFTRMCSTPSRKSLMYLWISSGSQELFG